MQEIKVADYLILILSQGLWNIGLLVMCIPVIASVENANFRLSFQMENCTAAKE